MISVQCPLGKKYCNQVIIDIKRKLVYIFFKKEMLTARFLKIGTISFFKLTRDKPKYKIENNILRFGTYLTSVVEMQLNAC